MTMNASQIYETTEPTTEAERLAKWREETTAMVFLYVWGSQSSLDAPWTFTDENGEERTYAYTNAGSNDLIDAIAADGDFPSDVEADDCVCVLHEGWDEPTIPPGYRMVHKSGCGERECPECEGRGMYSNEQADGCAGITAGDPCLLCNADGEEDGSGLLYWGEEWSLVVFAPRYSYGSGMSGCSYDNGPHSATSIESAIDALVEAFDSYFEETAEAYNHEDLHKGQSLTLPEWAALNAQAAARAETEETAMRAALASDARTFRFSRPDLAGADYAEIQDLARK